MKQIAEVVNLIPDSSQRLWSGDLVSARAAVLAADPARVLAIRGSFALVAHEGERVVLARSLDRPLRYFLAKATDGPVLIVAERIDEIEAELGRRGWSDQFHPSYTRMAPAHHVTTLRLIGCPDPNPTYRRFFDPPRGTLPPDLDVIGRHYIEALYAELDRWLLAQAPGSPIGVPFSGGIDSGSVLLCLNRLLLDRGEAPTRLKAFTLSVDGGGDDARQAREFLARTGLEMLGETIDVPSRTGGKSAELSIGRGGGTAGCRRETPGGTEGAAGLNGRIRGAAEDLHRSTARRSGDFASRRQRRAWSAVRLPDRRRRYPASIGLEGTGRDGPQRRGTPGRQDHDASDQGGRGGWTDTSRGGETDHR